MAGRKVIFDPPDRFVPGAGGQAGRRTCFLQARKGSAVLSVALEKVQVALLAERIGALIEELGRRGIELPRATSAGGPGAAGRPPCPICGEPLDPEGHICLRRNGYVM